MSKPIRTQISAPKRGAPPPATAREWLYPWSRLRVGEHFDVTIPKGEPGRKYYMRVSASARSFARRRADFRFTVRWMKSENVIRAWRIESTEK